MTRAAFLAGACIVALTAGTAAAAPRTARADAEARIVEAATVRMNWAMAMPSVRGTANGAGFAGNAPTMSMSGGMTVRNESLAVQPQGGDAAALTAPGSFIVMRLDGSDALLLRTGAGGAYGALGDGIVLGGQLVGGSAASIDVGGRVWLASAHGSQAPPSGQMLIVVVQYN